MVHQRREYALVATALIEATPTTHHRDAAP
jgi:hypothetical protein